LNQQLHCACEKDEKRIKNDGMADTPPSFAHTVLPKSHFQSVLQTRPYLVFFQARRMSATNMANMLCNLQAKDSKRSKKYEK
jgi:hypothetical protein